MSPMIMTAPVSAPLSQAIDMLSILEMAKDADRLKAALTEIRDAREEATKAIELARAEQAESDRRREAAITAENVALAATSGLEARVAALDARENDLERRHHEALALHAEAAAAVDAQALQLEAKAAAREAEVSKLLAEIEGSRIEMQAAHDRAMAEIGAMKDDLAARARAASEELRTAMAMKAEYESKLEKLRAATAAI